MKGFGFGIFLILSLTALLVTASTDKKGLLVSAHARIGIEVSFCFSMLKITITCLLRPQLL